MDEALDDISISDRSFIVNDISGQDLVAGGLMEDENQSMEVATLNFSPTRAFLPIPAQSPIVPLRREFDETNGYDSDDGPSFNAVNEEGPLISDEDALPDNTTVDNNDVIAEVVPENVVVEEEVVVIINNNDIDKLKVNELKNELQRRGLTIDGKKAELKVRLKDAMLRRVPLRRTAVQDLLVDGRPNIAVVPGFPQTARWKILNPIEDPVQEPVNNFLSHAPTIPAEDAAFVPVKRNFAERFSRETFSGVDRVAMTFKNKKVMKDRNGSVMYEDKVRKVGVPCPLFLKQHKLNAKSSPARFFEAFLPVSENTYRETDCSIERFCQYTNYKAMLSFAGDKRYPYSDFKPFTVSELKQHLALYIVNGLCPSPRAEMKLQSQSVDPINGNDFIFRSCCCICACC